MQAPAPHSEAGSAEAADYLRLENIAKAYGATRVVENLDFSVDRGELVSLLGPSGCGKTTLLKLICGLIRTDRGTIAVGGRNVTRLPAHKRNVSVVFQNYALFPHLNVADNVAFGLKARKAEPAMIPTMVTDALRLVRMEELSERPVGMLSGGQQQRVAVARALVVGPDLLLLDEPFSALDRKLREAMQVELKSLLRARGMTAVFVTHDQEEALAVSSRIAVMNAGRIEQYADPMTLYAQPSTAFVLDFVGLSTRLSGRVSQQNGSTVKVDTNLGPVMATADFAPGERVVVGVRPERVTVASAAEEGESALQTTLADVMPLGSKTHLHGATRGEDRLIAEVGVGEMAPPLGERVTFSWPADATLIYREGSGPPP